MNSDFSSQQSSQKTWLAIVIVLVIAIALALPLFDEPDEKSSSSGPVGGDFTFVSADGEVSLSQFNGKLVIIYFGYTFCPDICPTSLGLLSLALNELTEHELKQIQPIFISVDPERDTPEKLKNYASAFHPSIIGLTGTEIEIAAVAQNYGVMYARVETPESAMGYAVDHSSFYYLVGLDGSLNKTIPHGTHPTDLVSIIRSALNKHTLH